MTEHWSFPLCVGPLDDDEYIEEITEEFRAEQNRNPCGADELLHWHRRRMNKHLRDMGCEITADWKIADIGVEIEPHN